MIAAVVLAAGESSRMGKPKQTLTIGGVPMLQAVLETLRRTKVDKIVVVLGAHKGEVRKEVRFADEKVVVNRRYRSGMSGSMRAGLAVVAREADAVIFVLGDQPFLATETVDRVINAHLHSKASIVVPVHRGRRGNPVLFARSLFPQIMKVRGDVGAKSVVLANPKHVLEVEVEGAGELADVDTPGDYEGMTPSGN